MSGKMCLFVLLLLSSSSSSRIWQHNACTGFDVLFPVSSLSHSYPFCFIHNEILTSFTFLRQFYLCDASIFLCVIIYSTTDVIDLKFFMYFISFCLTVYVQLNSVGNFPFLSILSFFFYLSPNAVYVSLPYFTSCFIYICLECQCQLNRTSASKLSTILYSYAQLSSDCKGVKLRQRLKRL
jgi:hypothetical protein